MYIMPGPRWYSHILGRGSSVIWTLKISRDFMMFRWNFWELKGIVRIPAKILKYQEYYSESNRIPGIPGIFLSLTVLHILIHLQNLMHPFASDWQYILYMWKNLFSSRNLLCILQEQKCIFFGYLDVSPPSGSSSTPSVWRSLKKVWHMREGRFYRDQFFRYVIFGRSPRLPLSNVVTKDFKLLMGDWFLGFQGNTREFLGFQGNTGDSKKKSWNSKRIGLFSDENVAVFYSLFERSYFSEYSTILLHSSIFVFMLKLLYKRVFIFLNIMTVFFFIKWQLARNKKFPHANSKCIFKIVPGFQKLWKFGFQLSLERRFIVWKNLDTLKQANSGGSEENTGVSRKFLGFLGNSRDSVEIPVIFQGFSGIL